MRPFNTCFTEIESFIKINRKPDFDNLIKILEQKKPSRPTLFEYFMCDEIYNSLTRYITYDTSDEFYSYKKLIDAFRIAGYDYVTMTGSDFCFHSCRHNRDGRKSISLNEGSVISDRDSFEAYDWPEPENFDYSRLEKLEGYLPDGMKIIVTDPDGVLESVVKLVGYDNLCFMLKDDPELVFDIFDEVGSRMVRYHKICAGYNAVGAHIFGDDWGFNTQTLLAPADLRKYLFPWHKKMVEAIHSKGKKVVLHSCGRLTDVFDDIIEDMKFDGKHSYEDKIFPVEEAYEKYGGRIAVLGGLDVDFVCRSAPEDIYSRACAMLERSSAAGGYALGSGNSIPYYLPEKNYLAMISAAVMNEG